MKAVGCIATLCLLVTYLGTCQSATTDATTDASTGSTNVTAGVTTVTNAPGTTAPPVAVGGDCTGGKTCVAGLVCDSTCKLGPGGNCASATCQTGTTCTSNACTVNAGLVGFACTDNSTCTTANSVCETTSQKCQCKTGIKENPINLTCPSGSATVMASVLVLAVAFVKTQLF